MIHSEQITIETRKADEIINLTPLIEKALSSSGLKDGIATIFCMHSTTAITTTEYEPGLLEDVPKALQRLIPEKITYAHNEAWHDDNGHSHVKGTLLGPSLTIPFVQGKLTLGTWQQIVLFELDTKGRSRHVALQFLGQ